MSENNAENVSCISIPGNLDRPAQLKIDTILNEAAGGDYVTHIQAERLVESSTGFTLNESSPLELCLNFQLSATALEDLEDCGVKPLPVESARKMNQLRWD